MDKVEKYRQIVKNAILQHSDFQDDNREESEAQLVFDDERGHYYLMDIGWDDMERIHTCLLHLDVKKDGKVWIHKDFVEAGIATELMDAGIPKKDIVLAFHAPFKRPFTEFAVA